MEYAYAAQESGLSPIPYIPVIAAIVSLHESLVAHQPDLRIETFDMGIISPAEVSMTDIAGVIGAENRRKDTFTDSHFKGRVRVFNNLKPDLPLPIVRIVIRSGVGSQTPIFSILKRLTDSIQVSVG